LSLIVAGLCCSLRGSALSDDRRSSALPEKAAGKSDCRVQFVIFSTRADSIFAEHTAPPVKGKAVYTITE
jgi:hypothetical protein